jgi:predicted DNA binding CopG/RHH family protein
MSTDEERDPITGLTDAEMEAAAEDLYEHRDEVYGEVVPSEHVSDVRSVVSVRFARGEIGQVERAATAAGLPLSTYIRIAALSAAANVDVEAARRELLKATQALEELGRNLDGRSRPKRSKRAA